MAEAQNCPQCGAGLSPEAPQGLCPECLLKAGLSDGRDSALESELTLPVTPQASGGEGDTMTPGNPGPEEEPVAPAAGTKIRYFGDYELFEEIARGGMGVVYRARQTSLNRIVALKMILSGHLAAEEEVKRFRMESEAAANLQHPNIVAIHEVGEYEGQHYFSMDYVEGQSLSDLVRKNPLPARKAAEYVKTIAEAIGYAHEQGTLHRDLKPSNILIDTSDQPRITDFGLAKRVEVDSGLTATGQVLGTPSYMPPEQADSKRGEVSPSSDVYSMGGVLYELLTGRPAFQAESPLDTLKQVLDSEPVSPRLLNPNVPLDLETVCLKCLQKEPQKRYPTPTELAEDLGRFITGQPILARPVGSLERTGRWCRRNPALATTGGLALLASIVVVCLSIGFAIHQSRAATMLQRTLAENYLDRGLTLCEHGDVSLGMLWLGRGLETAPTDSADLGQAIRGNIAAWRPYVSELTAVLRHPGAGRGVSGSFVQDVAFSPDGQTILTSGFVVAQRWDAVTGQRIGEPMLHPGGRIHDVAFSFDGTRIVTAGNKTVQVWDALSGSTAGEPLQHESLIFSMALSPEGKTVLIGGADGTAVLLDLATGKRVGEPFRHGGAELAAVAFGPDGSRVLTGGVDGTARRWDRATGKAIGEPLDHDSRGVSAVAFSPDGTTILTGGPDGTVRLWDADTGEPIREPLIHGAGVEQAIFSPDGRLILAGCVDNAAFLWDRATGRRVGEPMRHGAQVLATAFSPDGETLLTGSNDTTGRLWRLPREKPTPTALLVRDARRVAISPDGRTIATGHGAFAQLWDADTAEPIGSPVRHPELIQQVRFLPGGTVALTGTHGVEFLDGTSGESTGRIHDPELRVWAVSRHGRWLLTTADRSSAATDAARSRAAGAGTSRSRPSTVYRPAVAQVRDARTGAAIGQPLRHDNDARRSSHLRAAVFSPNGKLVLTGTTWVTLRAEEQMALGEARLWDAATGKLVGGPFEQMWDVEVVAFSPDGKVFLTGGHSGGRGSMRLWAAASGRPIGPERAVRVKGAAFSPDGTIAATDGGMAVRLWKATTGEPIGRPLQHQQSVTSVTFSPDGRLVLTGSEDKTARLWNTMTGRPVGPVFSHGGGVRDVVFSPDGSRFIAGLSEGTAAIWKVPSTTLDGSREQIVALMSVVTGVRLDTSGAFEILDARDWDQLNDEQRE